MTKEATKKRCGTSDTGSARKLPDEKALAMEQFAEAADLERKIQEVISRVIARSPNAVLIAWEEADGVKATTIPYSAVLAKGMADTLFEMLCVPTDQLPGDD